MDIRHNIPMSDLCSAGSEAGECSMAELIAPRCRNVLEIGAGPEGNVSQAIQRSLSDPSKHIAFEVDKSAYDAHRAMMEKRGLKHELVHGVASSLPLDTVKQVLGGDVHCIISDCEACLLDFFGTDVGKDALKTAEFISNEMDGFVSNDTHDVELRRLWARAGLCPTTKSFGCNRDCDTELWQRSTCVNIKEKCANKAQDWGCEYLG